jgi:hypothetical protein
LKLSKATLASLTIIAALLIGAIIINAQSAPGLKVKAKWRPPNYTLGGPVPNPWNAEIYFAPPQPVDRIDPNTIKLEGTYTPSGTPTIEITGRLVVPFSGNDVLTALLLKAVHMTPGQYRILLTITGNLKAEYGGTPFSGDGGINLIVPDDSGSPP